MTDEQSPTMKDGAFKWGLSKHRSLEIIKAENGYTVRAMFPIPTVDDYVSESERRMFVFQTLSETIAWVDAYLSADQTNFKRQMGWRNE